IKPTFFEPRQHEIFHDIVANESGISSDYVGLDKFKYCGKLFNTYLILERENEIVLIDQHAAHEKILYDDLSTAVNEGAPTIQDLLMPYIFDVDQNEAELIMENIEEISALGFSLYKLSGNTFSLSSVPLILSEIRLKDFVALLIEALKKDKLSKHGFIKEELMQSACKSAVKGEMNLSESEVNKLIETIVKKKIDLFCPHGRPIAIKIKRNEIEKWFKRIV
ncbi:MAG: hypothetical protein IJX05_04405, partial [Clostridia bacterium]|nr:hypothetical protein [Clostridia bacterium]